MLWVYGETDSPSALGVWTSLTWVGDADQATAPLTNSVCAPSQNRVIAEFMLACEVSAGSDYPAATWWTNQRFTASEIPDRGWWDAHAGWGMGRNEALGVSVALGWLFGQIDDPAHMVPAFRGDGSDIPHGTRQEWGLGAARPGDGAVVRAGNEPGSRARSGVVGVGGVLGAVDERVLAGEVGVAI